MSTELVNGIYLIKNTGSGKYLNVWGIDQVGNSRNVNQYDLSAELSQVFWVQKTTTGVLKLSSIIKDANGAYYSLNVNTNTFNANLYKETASNDQDSALAFESVGNGNYKIRVGTKYDGNTYFLTALGNVNGTNLVGRVNGNVVWATEAENSAYQVWAFEYMAPYRSTYDIRKLDAQIFLHKFYQSTCEIDAKAGTVLCMELVKALQKILLNISTDDEGYGYFGEKTLAACPTMQTGMATTERNKKLVTLFCHAMFCKGYSTTAIYDSFNANVANGVKKIQADMGMPQTGVVTPLLMKAVFNTDSYVLSSKGDARIREIQQAMNNGYSEYSGINPCDGIYSRATNKALIYAIQKEEGISVENSAPSFGQTTFSLFPTLPFTGDSKETGKNEANITKILQYALYVNAMYAGDFDGVYSATVSEAVQKFQTFMAYPGNTTTYADARVMKGLLASCGDTSRLCTALDTATILTKPVLTNLKNMGIKYVGRYLTGMVKTQEGKRVSKKITRSEAENILAAGLNIIPISQNVARGKRMGYKHGKFAFPYGRIIGYRKGADGKPEIIPEQAEVIRLIFNSYLQGDSLQSIKTKLETAGALTARGNTEWSAQSIQRILQNEKYCGDVLLQKTFTEDVLTGVHKKNTGQLPQYYIENYHEGIVSKQIFREVQAEIARRNSKSAANQRKRRRGRYNSKYALTERLVCGDCGSPYKRVTWNIHGRKQIVWRCVNRIEYGTKFCGSSPSIPEEKLHRAILKAVQDLAANFTDEVAAQINGILHSIQTGESIKPNLQEQLEQTQQEFDRLLEMSLDFDEDTPFLDNRLKKLNNKIKSLKKAIEESAARQEKARQPEMLLSAKDLQILEYDDALTARIIEKITVRSRNEIEIRFIGGYKKTMQLS